MLQTMVAIGAMISLVVLYLLTQMKEKYSTKPVFLMFASYMLGVYNERLFPGGRMVPLEGEEIFLVGLCTLAFVAARFFRFQR
jgi:hypothetical protein